ncbi:MAG: imidazole glycerol phosphate synthase subunit HisH [Candidatus Dormibacteraeota bacterium]|nr:imidazole glycerol phosphate synthase subunit HisH [Candidatus Dormibacteraeota bacterium]
MTTIAVCDYGAGNTRSVLSALGRTGATVTLTGDARFIGDADLAVLPGVGAARSAMEALRHTGQDRALRDRVSHGRPVLGICLGLQLALERSDEDGGVEGLAILPGRVTRLTDGLVPRLGWGLVEPWGEAYYFAHSYAAETAAAVATSDGVVAAAATGSFLGVQFHPEKSGPAGERFLARYVAGVAPAAGVA